MSDSRVGLGTTGPKSLWRRRCWMKEAGTSLRRESEEIPKRDAGRREGRREGGEVAFEARFELVEVASTPIPSLPSNMSVQEILASSYVGFDSEYLPPILLDLSKL